MRLKAITPLILAMATLATGCHTVKKTQFERTATVDSVSVNVKNSIYETSVDSNWRRQLNQENKNEETETVKETVRIFYDTDGNAIDSLQVNAKTAPRDTNWITVAEGTIPGHRNILTDGWSMDKKVKAIEITRERTIKKSIASSTNKVDSGGVYRHDVDSSGETTVTHVRTSERVKSSSKSKTGYILGGSGILLLALLVYFYIIWRRKRANKLLSTTNR